MATSIDGGGMTRRAFLRAAALGAGALALAPAMPRAGMAYPFTQETVTGSSLLPGAPVEVVESLCSAGPDEVSFSGNPLAKRIGAPGNGVPGAVTGVCVRRSQDPAGLEVRAVYGRVGRERSTGREVGCEVTLSEIVKGGEVAVRKYAEDGRDLCGVAFGPFSSPDKTLWALCLESMAVEERFFYADDGRTVPFAGAVVSVVSLDHYRRAFSDGAETGCVELCQVPDEVKRLYRTSDSMLDLDLEVEAEGGTYAHCCGSLDWGYSLSSAEYDRYSLTKHGFSWEVPGEAVSYRVVMPLIGHMGFNATLRPICNMVPDGPEKAARIEAFER